MISLDDMALFVEVAKFLSFRKASESLNVPASTLSRRVSSLEKAIGLRLIKRTTRYLELTEAGQLYFQRSSSIIEEAKGAHLQLGELLTEPVGILRVSLPIDFTMAYLVPIIIAFSHEHPKVRFEFDLTPRRADLISDPWDLAIRMGEQPNSGLISRHIASVSRYLYASPEYLLAYGTPKTPDELCSHLCLKMNTPQESKGWALRSGNDTHIVTFESKYSVNNIGLTKALAIMGEGIALLSTGTARQEINNGQLVRVLPLWEATPLSVYALTETRLAPLKVSSFIEHLRNQLQKESI